jgi:adenylate cyclase class 2
VAIETEVKVRIGDPESICGQLMDLRAAVVSGRHFEDNCLLDFPDGTLQSERCLLRIRFADGKGILTFKGAPQANGIFKTREELETGIEDGAVVLQILERIGMLLSFRYQKYRREFLLESVHIAVDETPIGNYIELEGSEDTIRRVAGKLGIDESLFLRLSYYSLYLEYCREKHKTPEHMIF